MKAEPQIWYIGPQGEYSDKIKIATIEQCYEYCLQRYDLGIDIETCYKYPLGTYKNESIYKPGLDPYLSKVVMLQIGDEYNIFVIDTRTTDITKLLRLFQIKDITWHGANLRFEAKHLLHNYGVLFHKIYDVMLVDMVLTNGLGWSKDNKEGYRYSLEALSDRYLGIKPVEQKDLFSIQEEDEDQVYIDKSTRMGFLTIGSKLFTEKQILYGADDILYPLQIKKLQQQGFRGYNPKEVIELENEFCLVLADIELTGITFDKEQWLKNCADNQVVYNRRLDKLNKWVEKYHPKYCAIPDLFNPNSSGKCTIEWSSSKQVASLFKDIGFCPKEKSKETKKMEYTVGAKALLKLLPSAYKELYEKDKETDIVEQRDLILNYLLLKTSEQAITTFGSEFLKYIHPITGRLHSTYKQILHTGRISSNNPNLQNIPADEGYRKAFTKPENCSLINADYASQETRILAEVSGDEAMISFFNDGHPVHGNDFHSFTATKMFSLMRNEPDLIVNKKTHPEERNTAKNISFKIPYGGSAYTLKDDFGVSEEIAQEFIDGYMRTFPKLDEHFKKGREHAVKHGYVDIIPDRRYWDHSFDYMKSINEKIWKWYPENYKKLTDSQKVQIKEKIKKDHPEVTEMWREFFSLKGSLERVSQNYKIQGLAGSQTKKAGILFRKKQIEENLRDKVWLTNLIHDEVSAETVQEYEEQGLKLVVDSMIEGANEYCKNVKMEATGGICEYWSH